MRSALCAALLMVVACGNDKPAVEQTAPKPEPVADKAPAPAPTEAPPPAKTPEPAAPAESAAPAPAPAPAAPAVAAGGHDFTPEGKALLVVGACGEGTPPATVPAETLAKHCEFIKKVQDSYVNGWLTKARAFFAEKVPKDVPKKVVYPFAGGDLSTALTVYPDADEITTISLEPAGDPRTIDTLQGKELDKALSTVQYELKFLYRVNFSNTLNMIDAMRGGALPTELIFGLSALKIHGFELVALRYFSLNEDGTIHYLEDADYAKSGDPTKPASAKTRNMVFANAEVQFKRANGRVQVWRHIRGNLGNDAGKGIGDGLKKDPRIVKHLEAKGTIAGMTKAASYLLSWDSFSIMRDYLIGHVQWMVSDATGVAPKWGKKAGFEYETYGIFNNPHIPAGTGIASDWRKEFKAQEQRDLNFRFGYYDKNAKNHLIIMRKKS
jgi:hypothetical protein